jgi:rRNA-processing protein FCF1
MPQFIIVDTSSIIFGLSHRSDVFNAILAYEPSYKPVVSEGVVNELKGIGSGRGRYAKYARAGLELIRKHGIEVEDGQGYVDSWILRKAFTLKFDVCTNDTALRRKLKEKGIKTFSLSIQGYIK